MSISKKREEILRLIDRVHGRSNRAPIALPTATTRDPRRALPNKELARRTERVAARNRQLVELRGRRQAAEGPGAELFDRVVRIERRLDEVVETLQRQLSATGARLPGHREVSQAEALESIDWTVGGVLQEGLLADVLQMVSSNVLTGVFLVVSESSRIEMYFNEGDLQHAASDDGLEGESAFFAAMATEVGRYCFRETKDLPPEQSITNKTQFLILEALRQIDEARSGG